MGGVVDAGGGVRKQKQATTKKACERFDGCLAHSDGRRWRAPTGMKEKESPRCARKAMPTETTREESLVVLVSFRGGE